MTFVTPPTKEGDESKCVFCGIRLVGRLTDYGGKFADYIQWQHPTERKAHYLKDGGCKGVTTNTSENKPEANITPVNLDMIDSGTRKQIEDDAILLHGIRKIIEDKIKDNVIDPNPAMIGQYVGLIWNKHFAFKNLSLGGDGLDA